MPLLMPTLAQSLLPGLSIQAKFDSAQDAGRFWANAYDSFARGGVVAGIPVLPTPASTIKLQQDFASAFRTPGVSVTTATLLGTGLVTYWLTTIVTGMLSPPVPGIGLAPFIANMSQVFSNAQGTAQSKAQQIATAFYTFSIAVTVAMPPSGNPVPVA